MSDLLGEIKADLAFVRSRTLQPRWYKALTAVMLAGFLAGYGYVFGLARTAAFLVSLLLLSFIVDLAQLNALRDTPGRTEVDLDPVFPAMMGGRHVT